MKNIPFNVVNWKDIKRTEHKGETGFAYWRSCNFDKIRVRMVEYTPGYRADHWCEKGHILLVLAGELITETEDGKSVKLFPGMSYQVGDNELAHRSCSEKGAKLFIVD